FAWGEELIQEAADPDGSALTTTYSYYEIARRLQSVTRPDGSWEKYTYDERGDVSSVLRSWKDQPLVGATETNSRARLTQYGYWDGNGASSFPKSPIIAA